MPPARLLAASAINWFGSGLFHSSVAVFAVAVLPVGPATVGLAFALGGVAGILLSVMVARFADRHDAKAVLSGAYAVQGMLLVLYAADVHDRATRQPPPVAFDAVDVAPPTQRIAVTDALAAGTGR